MNFKKYFIIISILFFFLFFFKYYNYNYKFKSNIINNNVINNIYIKNKKNYFSKNKQFVIIKTDVLLIKINKFGGDVEKASLLSYPKKIKSLKPFNLLKQYKFFTYKAQSGLIGQNGIDNLSNNRPFYKTISNFYKLNKFKNKITVPMIYISKNGVLYKKIFIFHRNKFLINVNYFIKNLSKKKITIKLISQLKQTINKKKKNKNNIEKCNFNLYRGSSFSTDKFKFKKYSFDDIKKSNLLLKTKNGWITMMQRYFASCWIPKIKGNKIFYTRNSINGNAYIGYKSDNFIINSGKKQTFNSFLWIGPKFIDKMSFISKNLGLTVDYGRFWFISKFLLNTLKLINKHTNNYGISLIIITFIIRAILYPINKIQYTYITKMNLLQPKINKINKKFKNKKNEKRKNIIKLYKKAKINPFGGFLSIIIQMPIFLSLYYMIIYSIELRHANFIFWIKDLSSYDPYYILPIFMGITSFFVQKTYPNKNYDLNKNQNLNLIPIIFTIFFLCLPSGLIIYYIINNLLTILQQKFINKFFIKK
ncbi:MAG: membrane protein insertase YidC [Candidatus Makana argininalis]